MENKVIHAPVILFCFKRADLLRQTVEGLLKCPQAIHTQLCVFIDGPAQNSDTDGINAVKKYVETLHNKFESLHIFSAQENLGVDQNIIRGIKYAIKHFESFIVLEDDVLVSDQFLSFMNQTLLAYQHDPTVLTISGFSFIKRFPKNYQFDVYFAPRMNPWGWASWSAKLEPVQWSLTSYQNFIAQRALMRQFDQWGSDRSRMLRQTVTGKIKAWDILLDFYLFYHKKMTLYPVYNLVENIGFNTLEATNTTGYNRFKNPIRHFPFMHYRFPEYVFLNDRISKNFIQKNSIFNRLLTRILKILKIKN